MRKTAVITGIFGQDGSIVAELLLSKGYAVAGFVKQGHITGRKDDPVVMNLISACEIIEIDISDMGQVKKQINNICPDEFYHLAACHHSSQKGLDFDGKLHGMMFETNCKSTMNIIHAILESKKKCRLVFAGSSQMYMPRLPPAVIDETSPFMPSTFYGQTKLWSQQIIQYYRENHGLWACTAILFNHESTRRPNQFVSRKITEGAARIKSGLDEKIRIRNIHAQTDWSSAEDIVYGMHLMLSADIPSDYVLASGELHKVQDLLSVAFSHVGLDWKNYIICNESDCHQVPSLIGNSARIRNELGWQPKRDFKSWICKMVGHDYQLIIDSAS